MIANTGKLAGRTIFITGASRGIGKAIALKAAKDGANIVVAAKTAETHPKLPGTIYTAAAEIEAAGGKALPCIVDIRDEAQVQSAIDQAVKKFGGIDILVNNASAIALVGTAQLDMKKYDLMHDINIRGTFLVSKLCLPHLKNSNHAHILNLSPPLNLSKHWFTNHVAYTIAKYGMSMCVLGMAEEFRPLNIAVNALWPRTAIDTAAIRMLTGTGEHSRKPDILADAAYAILSKDPKAASGNFFIDEDVVKEAGVTDLVPYACNPANADSLMMDGFIDDEPCDSSKELLNIYNSRRAATKGNRLFHTSTASFASDDEKKADSGSQSQIRLLFEDITKTLNTEIVGKTQAIFQFNVKGKEEGVWYLDLKNGEGSCGQGEPPSPADATLTMDSKNFFDMFTGKLKPANAFMMGKLKITGDLQKAMKLEKLMKSLKSKL
ncbi:hydroxysteroid dehydrogenase like 2 isoform X1 [Arctopsyche grandis]|uniref:hydroxysteroid dehydrogenase like 2 isoform X1 n=1 Tax=Arctopsyche grandis TaxID=121162 RepID=UPI00406D9E0C